MGSQTPCHWHVKQVLALPQFYISFYTFGLVVSVFWLADGIKPFILLLLIILRF